MLTGAAEEVQIIRCVVSDDRCTTACIAETGEILSLLLNISETENVTTFKLVLIAHSFKLAYDF